MHAEDGGRNTCLCLNSYYDHRKSAMPPLGSQRRLVINMPAEAQHETHDTKYRPGALPDPHMFCVGEAFVSPAMLFGYGCGSGRPAGVHHCYRGGLHRSPNRWTCAFSIHSSFVANSQAIAMRYLVPLHSCDARTTLGRQLKCTAWVA